MIEHEATATLPIGVSEIDLAEWLFNLTDEDYQKTARGHRALGVHRHPDRLGMINVESIGGSLIIQHYHATRTGPSLVEMLSPSSTGYLMHLIPVGMRVRWIMAVAPASANTSTLTCRVEVGMSRPVRLVGTIFGASRAIRRHTEEETEMTPLHLLPTHPRADRRIRVDHRETGLSEACVS